MQEAILYKKLDDNKVQCLACCHYCKISQGQSGICGVRKNIDGKLYLLVYGQAVAVNIDPIEKKPLYHFLPGTMSYSLGTVGCNFACGHCQNWNISQISKKKHGEKIWGEELLPAKIVAECLKHKLPSISYTYNEPTVWAEYAYDTMELAHEKGIKNIFVSNGYFSPEALKLISPYLDAINVDLKSFRAETYQKLCKAKLQPVLDNIKRLHELGIHQEITTLLITDTNDSVEEITQLAEFIAKISKSIPWHISKFFPQYEKMDLLPTPEERMIQAYEIGKQAGLKYVYLGNIAGGIYSNTYCPKCGELAIERVGYRVRRFDKDGKCGKCGERLDMIY